MRIVASVFFFLFIASAANASEWKIREDKSPIDDSEQVLGFLLSDTGDASIAIRCKERKTEFFFSNKKFLGIKDSTKVIFRVGSAKAVTSSWSMAQGNRAVFAPSAIALIKSFQDDDKLFIRVFGHGGDTFDATFDLGAVSAVRTKVAAACKWPNS